MTQSVATSAMFTRCVTLTEAEPRRSDIGFTALTQACPWPKAYGGDMVAQASAAAMRSVTDGKSMHSMHSYFLRPVDIDAEVHYDVEVTRDGRRFATRQVRAYQNDKVTYIGMVSFAAGGTGGSLSSAAPTNVPAPESLPASAQYLSDHAISDENTMTTVSKEYWSAGRSFDMRHVPGPIYLDIEGGRSPHQAIWVRPFDRLRPVDGLSDAQRDLAALAYVCDYTILEPALRALGHPWAEKGLVTASLDHAMWFHRTPEPGAMDGWLLYAQEAVAADRGRGVGLGKFFTPEGIHLATVVQEGMIDAETTGAGQ